MSRVGKLPITILEGVTVTYDENTRLITVTGPKGTLSWTIPEGVGFTQSEGVITFELLLVESKALWGLARALVANMIHGVHTGYEKKLQVLGVGYNAKMKGSTLLLNLGHSHPIEHAVPDGVEASVEKDPKGNDLVLIKGIDKQLVGEQAAKIRSYRKPEPYKGKGVRYLGEYIKMKAGKTAAKK